jgi:hypothetical protein
MAIAEVAYTVEPLWTHSPLFNGEPWGDRNPSVAANTPVEITVQFKKDGVPVVPGSTTTWNIYKPNYTAQTPTSTANPSNGVFTVLFTPEDEGTYAVLINSGDLGSSPYVYVKKQMYFYVHRSNVDPYVQVPYS